MSLTPLNFERLFLKIILEAILADLKASEFQIAMAKLEGFISALDQE